MSPPDRGAGAPTPEIMIDVDGLTRYYGPVPALYDVSFQAHRGEIVGFLGPNGAGKTTAMRILTGYMPPSAGTARICGHDVVEDSLNARKAIGYLPENTPLYTDMTVSGYLDYMAKLRGVTDRRESVERVMRRVSIDNRADDLIGQLSKGLRQRVGIAQALVHDPEVIILDEPTIGLDPRQIREVRGLIRELGGDHTIILSTHILSEAEQICDRVLIISRGEIVAADALERLASQSRHGGEQVRLAVEAPVADGAVAEVLRRVAGVAEVQALGEGVFSVATSGDRSVRSAVAAAVTGSGWGILELTPIELTLEDIFLQVTASHIGRSLEGEDAEESDAQPDAPSDELSGEDSDEEWDEAPEGAPDGDAEVGHDAPADAPTDEEDSDA
jgi:ABC-2 type transport system ATP-binding protein